VATCGRGWKGPEMAGGVAYSDLKIYHFI
jgi:hypothetical protein